MLIPRFREEVLFPLTADEIEFLRTRDIKRAEEAARNQARIDAAQAKRDRRAAKKRKEAQS